MAGWVRIEVAASGKPVVERAWMADTWRERIRGLLGVDALPPEQGLWLVPCGSVHTFGMRFPIDILFLDRQNQVLAVAHAVGPCRVRMGPWKTRSVLELAAGTARRIGLREGDRLSMRRLDEGEAHDERPEPV